MVAVILLFCSVVVLYAGGLLIMRWWWSYGRFQPRGPYLGGFRPPSRGLDVGNRGSQEADELALMVYGSVKAPSVGGRAKAVALFAVGVGLFAIFGAMLFGLASSS